MRILPDGVVSEKPFPCLRWLYPAINGSIGRVHLNPLCCVFLLFTRFYFQFSAAISSRGYAPPAQEVKLLSHASSTDLDGYGLLPVCDDPQDPPTAIQIADDDLWFPEQKNTKYHHNERYHAVNAHSPNGCFYYFGFSNKAPPRLSA